MSSFTPQDPAAFAALFFKWDQQNQERNSMSNVTSPFFASFLREKMRMLANSNNNNNNGGDNGDAGGMPRPDNVNDEFMSAVYKIISNGSHSNGCSNGGNQRGGRGAAASGAGIHNNSSSISFGENTPMHLSPGGSTSTHTAENPSAAAESSFSQQESSHPPSSSSSSLSSAAVAPSSSSSSSSSSTETDTSCPPPPQHSPITYNTIYLNLPIYQNYRYIQNEVLDSFMQQLYFMLRLLQGNEIMVQLYTGEGNSRYATSRQLEQSNPFVTNHQTSNFTANANSTSSSSSHNSATSNSFLIDNLCIGQKAIHAVYKDFKQLVEQSSHKEHLKNALFEMIKTTIAVNTVADLNGSSHSPLTLSEKNRDKSQDKQHCNVDSLPSEEQDTIRLLLNCKNTRIPIQLFWPSPKSGTSNNQSDYKSIFQHHQFDFASVDCLQNIELSTLCLWLGWVYVLSDEKDEGLCWLDTAIQIIENTETTLEGKDYMFEYYSRARLWTDDTLIVREYELANKMRPLCPLPFNNLAIARTKLNQSSEALFCYNSSIRLDPLYCLSYNNRASLYSNSFHDYDKAEADYNTAINIGDDLPLTYINRASFFRTFRKDSRQALSDYTKCLEEFPDSPERDAILCDRADTYVSIGNPEAALEDFNECLQINPHNLIGLYNRGMLYAGILDRPTLALRDYTACIEQCFAQNASQRTVSGAYNNRGIIYQENLNDMRSALQDFQSALDFYPGSVHARNNLRNLRAQIDETWAIGNQ